MKSKTISVLIAIFIILCCWFYLETNGSYQLAFKARFYQSVGNYQNAYETSKQALKLDTYNKLAMSVFVNSQRALKLEGYVAQGKKFLDDIRKMSQKGVNSSDKARINMMCEIVINEYYSLSKTNIDSDLKLEAESIYENFLTLKKELFDKTN
ncbi:hypothetical protein [Campylobacter mucosalis]|uniref:hypothetical protein n=1 Tax=Campylobacter mucosalis TaxID=202 RepID=UPI0014700DEF|nr:hypothetical protein [Campylobacter mucosalis]